MGLTRGKLASDRVLLWALGALLTLCWMLGGVTQDSTSADELLQLAALPVVLLATVSLARHSLSRLQWLALLLAAAILAVPAFQLLPLPGLLSVGSNAPLIQADLATAGVDAVTPHAGVSRFASERGLWSLLPALAVFLGTLALPVRQLRWMLRLVLALVLASALFAFFQLSLPDDSSLLLYTEWGRNFGGAFANPNHQGSALSIGAVIAAAGFIDGRRRRLEGAPGHRDWLYAFLGLACVAMVPLANGSAAMLLVMLGLVVVVVMLGAVDWRFMRRRGVGSLAVAALLGVAVVIVASATALHGAESGRQVMAGATLQMGQQFAPWGAGVGSFVPVFAQYQDLAVARSELINHAHNEYAQWWLEAGVPALLVMAAGIGMMAWLGWQVLARLQSRRLRAMAAPAWTGLLLLLMHSLVDFPLRTTALMATAGLLAGGVLNVVNAARRTPDGAADRGVAAQRA